MKKTCYFLALFLFIYSCSINKQPNFIKVDNIRLVSFSSDTIELKADAFFENPNDIGGKISTDSLYVSVNDIQLAQIFSDDFKVPAKKEFSIPLIAKIGTKKLLNSNKRGVLEGLLSSLLSNKVTVRIKGNLRYSFLGFKKDFLVDKIQEIKI